MLLATLSTNNPMTLEESTSDRRMLALHTTWLGFKEEYGFHQNNYASFVKLHAWLTVSTSHDFIKSLLTPGFTQDEQRPRPLSLYCLATSGAVEQSSDSLKLTNYHFISLTKQG